MGKLERFNEFLSTFLYRDGDRRFLLYSSSWGLGILHPEGIKEVRVTHYDSGVIAGVIAYLVLHEIRYEIVSGDGVHGTGCYSIVCDFRK